MEIISVFRFYLMKKQWGYGTILAFKGLKFSKYHYYLICIFQAEVVLHD